MSVFRTPEVRLQQLMERMRQRAKDADALANTLETAAIEARRLARLAGHRVDVLEQGIRDNQPVEDMV